MLLDVGGAGHGFVANAANEHPDVARTSGRATCGARGVRLAVDENCSQVCTRSRGGRVGVVDA